MNKILLTALISLSFVPAQGQNKLSIDALDFLYNYRQERAAIMSADGRDTAPEPELGVIASLADGFTAADLEAAGFRVISDLGISAIVQLTPSEVDRLTALEAVRSVTFGGKKRTNLDFARVSGGVAEAHDGLEINGERLTFTGKGVLVGLFDSGLEANHINFSDANGKTRFQRVWHYANSYNTVPTTYTSSTVSKFRTDNSYETHATHVAGILCGSYKGNGNYAYTSTATARTPTMRTNSPIPYCGVATEADLAFGVGVLGDPMIIHGVDKIISHGESYGLPVVVNLSLGSNLGPHDGTDDYTASLNELGKRAIICMSAGNEADMDMSYSKRFSEGDLSFKTFLAPMSGVSSGIDAPFEVWSEDATPVTVTLATYRKTDGATTRVATNSSAEVRFNTMTGMTSGAGKLTSGIDAASGRYYVRMTPTSEIATSSNFYFSITVSGNAGKKAVIYYGGYGNFKSNNVEGYVSGNADESINTSAAADNIISVGSYTTRKFFGILGDSNETYGTAGFNVGTIAAYSSYGTRPDGTPLPTVLAPGSSIVSSISSYFATAAGATSQMTGSATNGGSTYYWGVEDGTSMASPFAAGVIALWLQADPTLNVDDVKKIIAETSTNDTYTRARPEASGAGKINAAAGLRYILENNAAIGTVTDDQQNRVLITVTGGSLEVVAGGEADFTITLHDLQGRCTATAPGHDAKATLDTSGYAPGMYIVTVKGQNVNMSRKVMIK